MPPVTRPPLAAAGLVALALLAAACGSSDSASEAIAPSASSDSDPILVVATTTILGDVIANVVGDEARLEVLVPIGVDPHDYKISSRQAALIQEADLVVANGLGFEEGLADVLAAAKGDGANIVELAELLDPISLGQDDDALDPHVWMDPLRMARGAKLIAGELDALDGRVDWAAAADSYSSRLLGLDEQIVDLLAGIVDRKLVSNHAVFGYFADRYDFEIVGSVIPSTTTLAEPSSADLARLVDKIEEARVQVILVGTSAPGVLAEAVVAEVEGGIELVEVYTGSLGGQGSGAQTLIDMLLTNAERIAEAVS